MPQEGSGTRSPDGGNKQTFTCKICSELYTKHTRYPISLNCGHTFCCNCIKKIGQNKTVIQCGICRGNTYSDYRRLGKNLALIELLEFANLLAKDDDDMEKDIDEKNEEDQEWQGATFIAESNLGEFYEEKNMLNEINQQFLPFPLRSRLELKIVELSGQVATIEAQMRKSGDNFRHIFAKMEKMRDSVMNQIAVKHTLHGQDGSTSSAQSDQPVKALLKIQQLPATPPSHSQQQSIMSVIDDGGWESSSGWGEFDDQDQE